MGDSLEAKVNENQRLASIAEQTADAIIMHDKNLKISFWNHSAETLFKYKRNEIIGKSAEIIVPLDLRKDFQKLLTIFKKEKSITNYETKRLTKDGELIDVSISASPLIDKKTKKIIGDIVSIRDLSEKLLAKKSQKELRQNRELTAIIQDHIEDERRSLARELHDELGQYVSAIKIFAANITNRTKGKNKDIEEAANSVTSAANQIYDGMHSIIRQLRPGALDNLGLSETLKDMISNYQTQNKDINIDLSVGDKLDHLGEIININIYRIIQEAMNNCFKHAKAKNIIINLNHTKKDLKLNFKDDGIGFDTKLLNKTKQFGLIGMQERVKALNGNISIKSVKKEGTSINISIPLDI
jgi:PAS domain S-box-containing protein